ncbi:lysophospholipid acyltransferase family protein [Longimicrobium sp.]|uniref:lysophospholipid acyltransferase family protein n=1 Tax=Longimicrobium sp. TaxID=2029185 RepID=UPI002CB10A45|nr:lysophospholipid acyltransferase family protein [Longimicrobium sp.]HSU16392.1 lysophospholipid acyltransferase family protein [Longimicrobium sp.]
MPDTKPSTSPSPSPAPPASPSPATARGADGDGPRHTPAHRVEYALARTLETAVATLPERVADAVGRRIGRMVYRLGIRRKVVEANLRLAYPGQPEAWIHATARAAYEHLGRESAAILRLGKLDRQAIVDRTVPVGWDELQGALDEGKGVILVTGHYGNWEIAAATVASRGTPIAAIVRRQGNRLVDARLNGLRLNLGVETITQREAPSRVPRLLRRNRVIGIVGDQDARRAGVFVPFFGRPASTHRGPALFALKLGAPVFACVARRLPGREVRYEVSGQRVPVVRTGDLEADVRALTAELAARLEGEVRKAPEQYFWFHRRWKSSPGPEHFAAESGNAEAASVPADTDPDDA